ncbi:MAG: hypothetical protein R2877_01255 [Bdellovibrionota bacterium]
MIDIVAMALRYRWHFIRHVFNVGGAQVAGWLFSAMSVGALLATLFSGWANKVSLRGRGVIISATLWGAIQAAGYSTNLTWILIFLGLAGAADMFSALFRKSSGTGWPWNMMRGHFPELK